MKIQAKLNKHKNKLQMDKPFSNNAERHALISDAITLVKHDGGKIRTTNSAGWSIYRVDKGTDTAVQDNSIIW